MRIYFNQKPLGHWVQDGDDFDFLFLMAGGDPITATIAAVGVGASGVASSYLQGSANRKAEHDAATLQQQGTAAAKGDINQYYGQAENLYTSSPQMTSGTAAANTIADLMGQNGPDAQAAAYAKFQTDPGYQFQVQQANQALGRSALAQGNIFSGNFMNASNNLNQNLASQQYGNYYNRLLGLSNTGFAGTQSLANLYQGQGTSLANADTNQATNLANLAVAGGQNQANMYGGMFNSLATGAGIAAGGMGGGFMPTGMNAYGGTSTGGAANTYSGMYQVPQLQPGLGNYGSVPSQIGSYGF